MELDWRNRCVGGERLEDLCRVVGQLHASDVDELFELLWDRPDDALPFHRALLRVSAELLWKEAATLRPGAVGRWNAPGELSEAAYYEVLERAGLELHV